MAFQNSNLLPWRRAIDNVLLPLEIVEPYRNRIFRERKYSGKARSLLNRSASPASLEVSWELSGGMQQRTRCRALIHEPEILMLDEPFGALDAFTREELWCALRDLQAERRVTVMLVTHDLREAVFLADTVYVMSSRPGRIVRALRGRHCAPARPRGRLTQRFQDIVHELRNLIGNGTDGPARISHQGRLARGFHDSVRDLEAVTGGARGAAHHPAGALGHLRRAVAIPRADHRQLVGHAVDHARGFLLATAFGLVLGIAVGWHRAIYAGIYPVLIGFNSIPKVAVVPVLILWFGLGEIPAVLTAFLISFFPIVVNVATGLATTEPELEDVLRALGASKLDIMRKVGIPRSLPYFFGSLKIAITLAFVGAVVSETVGANKGIGKLMLDAQAAFQVPIVFAGLLVLAVLGIVLYAATAMIEARFTGWAFRGQANR